MVIIKVAAVRQSCRGGADTESRSPGPRPFGLHRRTQPKRRELANVEPEKEAKRRMTRRRNPPPRPLRPNRSKKDAEQLDNDLRMARQNRKAEIHQKQMLRRLEWDSEGEVVDEDDDTPLLGADDDGNEGDADDEDADDEDETPAKKKR
jgi:hypothetical protein